jgi:hypothetical protein
MIDHEVKAMTRKALEGDGLWHVIDEPECQFLCVDHPYTHLVLTDASKYERVLESMTTLKRNSATSLEFIVRSKWKIIADDFKGPYYDSHGHLHSASLIVVTLQSGSRVHEVSVAVTYMASLALQQWTGAVQGDHARHREDLVRVARTLVETLLRGKGRDNSWDPLWRRDLLELDSNGISWIKSQVAFGQ